MAIREMTGNRDLSYSAWHRARSIGRFLHGLNKDKHRVRLIDGPWCEYPDAHKTSVADQLGMVDIDHVVYEGKHFDRKPIALIESARTFGVMVDKKATITAKLGEAAGIPVFVVLYELSAEPNPAQPDCQDIAMFYVRPYWPLKMQRYWQMTPAQYALFLVRLRQEKGNTWQPPLNPAWPLVDETDIDKLRLYEQERSIQW